MATKKTTAKKTTAKKADHHEPIYVSAKDIDLKEEHRADIHNEGYSQCVRALLQNWRQGTVACKGRSDVAFSNRKPWKQKGTGRARAGSLRSPLWRKGGVIFGPQERTQKLDVPKELRRKVANKILWDFLDKNKIVALEWAPQEGMPKTAHASQALKSVGLDKKDIVLFVTPADRFTHVSFANLPNVRMLLFDQWNVYDISNGELWMVLQKDMDAFKQMVNTWI